MSAVAEHVDDHEQIGTTTLARRHPVIAGVALGLAWGVVMRVWMRYIAANPEFSFAATGFILAASAIAGASLGWARRRRDRNGVGWWRYSVLSLFLLGAGGAVMWPAVLTGAAAIGLRRLPWLRLVLLAAAIASSVDVMQAVIDDNWRMSTAEAVIASAAYAPLVAFEAWAFSVVFTPASAGAPQASKLKRLAVALPVVAMSGLAVLLLGQPG